MINVKCDKKHSLNDLIDFSVNVRKNRLHYKEWKNIENLKTESKNINNKIQELYAKKTEPNKEIICELIYYKNFILFIIEKIKFFNKSDLNQIFKNLINIMNFFEKIVIDKFNKNTNLYLFQNILLSNYINVKTSDENLNKLKLMESKINLLNNFQCDTIQTIIQIKKYQTNTLQEIKKKKYNHSKEITMISLLTTIIIGFISFVLKEFWINKGESSEIFITSFIVLIVILIFAPVIIIALNLYNFLSRWKDQWWSRQKISKELVKTNKKYFYNLNDKEFSEKQAKLFLEKMNEYEKYKYNIKKQNESIKSLIHIWHFGNLLLDTYQNDDTDQGIKLWNLGNEIMTKQSKVLFKLTGKTTSYYNEMKK